MSDEGQDLRVTELADRAGVSVQLIRSYQSRGLLPPPRHSGRVALYGPVHLERLAQIRDLKARGHNLKAIAAMLSVDAPEVDVPVSIATPLRLDDVAEASGLPPEMIRSLQASHVVRPHRVGRTYRYADADIRAVRQLLMLLGVGLPLDEFLSIAARQLATADDLAVDVVAAWDRYVASHIRARGLDPEEEAGWIVASLRLLVSAVSGLVTYNITRAVLNAAGESLSDLHDPAVREAVEREVLRVHPDLGV